MSSLEERAAARVIERPRRILPLGPGELLVEAAWGGFMVVPAFNLDVAVGVTRDGLHEPWTTRLVQELLRPGQAYLNAGANFGYFVTLAGRMVGAEGRVIGVEPNPHILPFLMKSLYWNGTIGNTQIVARALSDTVGQALQFHFDPQYLGGGGARAVYDVPAMPDSAVGSFAEGVWQPGSLPRLFDADGHWIKGLSLLVPFEAVTTTIDAVAAKAGIGQLDLLHLDVEGSEALALLGARGIIEASPGLRLITEWSERHYTLGSAASRAAFEAMWDVLATRGYRVRMLEPRQAPDGAITVGPPLDFDFMTTEAPHGDYVWLPADQDPFA